MTTSSMEREHAGTLRDMPQLERATLPATVDAPAIARSLVREHTKLDSLRHLEADLLVTELVNNVIAHGSAQDFDLTIDLSHRRWVQVTATHDHPSPLEGPDHGIGFRLLDALSHSWGHGYDDGRLSVWFALRRPGSIASLDEMTDSDLTRGEVFGPDYCQQELVLRHRDLAVAIAKRYRGKGIADEDLQQVALMALLKAIRRYDADIGELRPYAAATISGELKRLLRDRGWSVRVPRAIQERVLETATAFEDLTHKLGREPSVKEMATHLGVTEEEVEEAMLARLAYTSRSVDNQATHTGLTLLDSLESDISETSETEDRLMLQEAIAKLPERQRLIMHLRFNEDMTQTEIAEVVGISQMHVSRLISDALDALRGLIVPRDRTA